MILSTTHVFQCNWKMKIRFKSAASCFQLKLKEVENVRFFPFIFLIGTELKRNQKLSASAQRMNFIPHQLQ